MQPYYEHNGISIFLGDCRDVLPTLQERVDLIFTSPPYNLAIAPDGDGGFSKQSIAAKGRKFRDGYGVHNDAMTPEQYSEWQRSVLTECWRVVDDTGAIFYNHKPRVVSGELWLPLTLNPGLPLRQILIWDRGGGVGLGDGHFCSNHEWIMVLARSGFELRDRTASAIGDVWHIRYETEKLGHPAPFPVELPARAIVATGAQTVLDPFMGSGTTLRAAKNLGRRAIGIEIEERYCEIAARRLSQEVMEFV
jgi:site-specific DNA-methyltransferase (adenine-specific)